MQVDFFAPYPYERLQPSLAELLRDARRVEAAVAFVTKPGAAILRKFLRSCGAGNARLVASVRFPTDLTALANLEDDFPGTVFLHTGFKTPCEEGAERGQFHSKLVLIEHDGDERHIMIGSHNWTQNALQGWNLEAGLVIKCRKDDGIVGKVRQHIDACARRSEPFDRTQLRFYQTIQYDLHVRPGPRRNEHFPGFEQEEALVIHAEDGTAGGLPDPIQLYLRLPDRETADFFPNNRQVILFAYPVGSLIGCEPPKATPTAYRGTVTMVNSRTDAPVRERSANCVLTDLDKPRIDELPGGPLPTGIEPIQAIVRLERAERGELPVFHCGSRPTVGLKVDYREVDRDAGQADRVDHPRPEKVAHSAEEPEALPPYLAPAELIAECSINLPGPDLYREPIEQLLNYILIGTDFAGQSVRPEVRFKDPAKKNTLNRHIYAVTHYLTEETMAQARRQLRLFETD